MRYNGKDVVIMKGLKIKECGVGLTQDQQLTHYYLKYYFFFYNAYYATYTYVPTSLIFKQLSKQKVWKMRNWNCKQESSDFPN